MNIDELVNELPENKKKLFEDTLNDRLNSEEWCNKHNLDYHTLISGDIIKAKIITYQDVQNYKEELYIVKPSDDFSRGFHD